jgi:hypothetical protein
VLFVPEFSFNLLSISSHLKPAKCSFTFVDNLCCIQDSHSRRIGTAKHRDGLYYMSLSVPATAGNVVSTVRHLELLHLDIWGPYSVNSIHKSSLFSSVRTAT